MGTWIARAWRGLATGWQLAGATLLLLAVLEAGTRVVQAARDRARGVRDVPYSPGDPQEGLPWHAAYWAEFDAARQQRWEPYVYWHRRPFRGRYITVDSAGFRVTPQPGGDLPVAARVWLFGGSTMWGTSQRDSATIAAEVARRLAPLAPAGTRIEVVNRGENGWVGTQEALALALAVRDGARPDVVLFLDGINDVAATVQWGTAGIPQNEYKRVREFAIGRTLDRAVTGRGLADELAAVPMLLGELAHQSAFVRWVESLAPRTAMAFVPMDTVVTRTVRSVVATAELVEALGAARGFRPVWVWQPTLQGTRKRLTPFETRVLANGDKDPYWRLLHAAHGPTAAAWAAAMPRVAPGRVVDASHVFDGDSVPAFTDRIGHNPEAVVPKLVDAFWPVLRSEVERVLLARNSAQLPR